MCCCGKPTVNGEIGAYSWDGKTFSTRKPSAPELEDGDTLVRDAPGRCGHGTDSHAHHFCLVKRHGQYYLLVRHGAGDDRIELGARRGAVVLSALDSDSFYWVLQMIYHTIQHERTYAKNSEYQRWHVAAAEKRIKTRKMRGRDAVKVSIE